MILRIIDWLENYLIRQMIWNYPDWGYLEYFYKIGNRIMKPFTYNIRESLIRQKRTLSREISMIICIARARAYGRVHRLIQEYSLDYYIDCYFLNLEKEAIPFFRCIFYLRFCNYFFQEIINQTRESRIRTDGILNNTEITIIELITQAR